MHKGITHFLLVIVFAFFAGYATAGENNALSLSTAAADTLLLIAQKDEVFEKYCNAAIQDNDANAQFTLGLFYATDHATKQDKHLAALLFYLAAEQQHKVALDWLMQVDGDPALANLPVCSKTLKRERTAFNTLVETSNGAKYETESLSIHDINKRLNEFEQEAPPMKKRVFKLANKIGSHVGVDPHLVMAFIATESAFNPRAKSNKNAQGLMQLIPATASRFNVKNPYNPEENIRGGVAYLKWLLTYFKGDVTLVAAAYNAGEGAVNRFGGIPPYAETRDYVRKIKALYKSDFHPYDNGLAKVSPVKEATPIKRIAQNPPTPPFPT